MAGRYDNFKGKGNTNGFDKRPKDAGRKVTTINHFLADMKELGYDYATKSQVEKIDATILTLNEEKIKEVVQNKKMPMIVRIRAKQIMSDKNGFEAMEKMLDRAIGKPTQHIQASQDIEVSITEDEKKLLEKLKNLAKENE